jgi:tetratricopeptide (TPR) repeat protein
MNSKPTNSAKVSFLAAIFLCSGPGLFAQTGTTPTQSNPSSPGSNGSIVTGKDTSPVNSSNVMNNMSTRESDAFKKFQAIPDSQFDKKVKVGEEFLKKFETSIYVPLIYSILAVTYIQAGQPEQGFVNGEKALALRPNDTRTLANLAQAMARMNQADVPDQLEKAQRYAEKCIQITPALTKPEGATFEEFAAANNQNLAMAHSALGTINIRRGKFADAIPDLKEAVRLDTTKDPTNLYLLGLANENSSHYANALDAFTKCTASAPANLQQTCRNGAVEAQKHIASQSSVPAQK